VTIRNRVLRLAIAPAALIVFAATSAIPADAQYYRWGPDAPPPPPSYGGRIHPQEIDARVRSMGFQPVAAPRPRGPLWVTHAVDRDGQHVRVLIDSYSGRVVDVLRPQGPPRSVALTPPANVPYPPDARYPNAFPPPANAPQSDYQDDDDDDDDDSFAYRNQPFPQQPQYQQPPQYQQGPQQGPNVIPFEQRGDNKRVPAAPKTNTAKKKETKKKKNETTAAVTPEKEKAPSPKARPQDAPNANAPKSDAPKSDVPKTAQTPKMPATDTTRAPDPSTTGAVKKNEVPTFDGPKNRPATPPVQPLL